MTRELTEEELSYARTVKDNWQAQAELRAEVERLKEKVYNRDRLIVMHKEFGDSQKAEIERLTKLLEAIARITSPGTRTLDELIRDMGHACDLARSVLTQHVAHRRSDEIHELRAETVSAFLKLEAEVERLQNEIKNCPPVSESEYVRRLETEIERLTSERANRYWEGRYRDEKAEVERLQAACERMMIGGNHIATYRTKRWPDYGSEPMDAIVELGAGREYDMWCCWNAIMCARDSLEPKPDARARLDEATSGELVRPTDSGLRAHALLPELAAIAEVMKEAK